MYQGGLHGTDYIIYSLLSVGLPTATVVFIIIMYQKYFGQINTSVCLYDFQRFYTPA